MVFVPVKIDGLLCQQFPASSGSLDTAAGRDVGEHDNFSN